MKNQYGYIVIISFVFLFVSNSSANITEGLIAYYPFNGNANDESGNGHHGEVHDADLIQDVQGRQAYSFNGVRDYIEIPNHAELNLESFTISFWVYRESALTGQTVLNKGWDSAQGWENFRSYFFNSGGQRFSLKYDDISYQSYTDVSTSFSTKEWRFVTGIVDNTSGKMKYYLDGVFESETEIEPFSTRTNYPLAIGIQFFWQHGPSSIATRRQAFHGSLDNIRIYNRPLSNSEIQDIYLLESSTVPKIDKPLTNRGRFIAPPTDKNPFASPERFDLPFEAHPLLVDIDNDGDFDTFINGRYGLFFYENIGTSTSPEFGSKQTFSGGEISASYNNNFIFVDMDGDKDYDLFNWLTYYENIGTPEEHNFQKRESNLNPLAHVSGNVSSPHLAFADIDDDGDQDVFVTGKTDSDVIINQWDKYGTLYYENIGSSTEPNYVLRTGEQNPFQPYDDTVGINFEGVFSYYVSIKFIDIDIDGDLDAFGFGSSYFFYFENIGTPVKADFVLRSGEKNAFYVVNMDGNAITFADLNGDNAPDALATAKSTTPSARLKYFQNISLTANPVPLGGSYTENLQVKMGCHGCEAIYYTLDGSEPTLTSPVYESPFEIDQDTTLKFFVADREGNQSPVRTENYIIDTNLPELSITFPQEGTMIESLATITGTAHDPVTSSASGIEKLEVELIHNGLYLTNDSDNPFSTVPTLLNIEGMENWRHDAVIDAFPQGECTLAARLTDITGNIAEQTVSFTIGTPVFTSLTLDTDSTSLLQNSRLTAVGKLHYFPTNLGIALNNLPISLNITKPSGTSLMLDTVADEYGSYQFIDMDVFNEQGTYTLQTSFSGQDSLWETSSEIKSILVGRFAGYAILVEGKTTNNEGLEAYNKTLNRIYRHLKERGFIDENIRYFNYDTTQPHVYQAPNKTSIQENIEIWAKERLKGSPAPLYVILVDHGNHSQFLMGDEVLTPIELNTWLNTLENGLALTPSALKEPRVVVMGACFSGSFIPTLSKSGRLVITSSAEDEFSYKGLQEPDGIRSGEYFMEALFQQLGRGENFHQAFSTATQQTELFTTRGSLSANTTNRFRDNAVQHPLLDEQR